MSPARKLAPLARWALVAAIVLMGGALAVTVWSTNRGVTGASQALLRGEAVGFHHLLHGELVQLGRIPDDADLAEMLEDHAAEGLRMIAIIGPGGRVDARAGKPAEDDFALRRMIESMPNDVPVRVGEHVRVLLRIPQHRPRRARRGGPGVASGFGRPSIILIEFEPRQERALQAVATRTLAIGGAAAGTLLVLALALVRWFMRRAAVERELERDRRLASLGQLSAVLAHEIRNPLASLKGNAQLLAGMLPAGEKPRSKADRVVDEAIRLEVLTNDLLEFARTGELRRAKVDPAALLAASAAAAAPGPGHDAVRVDTAAAPKSWSLDPDRMRQVLVNLIENAVQAGAPVRVSVAAAGGQLIFEVQDAGPGVPPEDVSKIFEPFYTKRTTGTGLGLAVAKRVVDLHDGTISVDSPAGGGALFRVSLPRGRE